MTVVVDGENLTTAQVERVARRGEAVALAPGVVQRMASSRERVERVLARGDAVYGMTTGLGERKRVRIEPSETAGFNRSLIDTHRVGTGEAAAVEVVRATMVCELNGFAKGTTGVRPLLAERLVQALNVGSTPTVRMLGSVGVADLAPLADLAGELFGDVALQANEGLALVSGNAFSTGCAALALVDARRLVESMTLTAALDLEAFVANLSTLSPAVAQVRPFPGLAAELDRLTHALRGSSLWQQGAARHLQDPLSYRSVVQLHGAVRDALRYAEGQVGIELNAHDSNPLVLPDEDLVISVGCFDSVPIAACLDLLRIAVAPCVTGCLERTAKLLQAPASGLASGLTPASETGHSGLAELLWTMHALTAEARLLAQPVSYELATTTTEEGLADRVTMTPLAARRLNEQIGLCWEILAIELVVAAQAIDLREPTPTLGAGTATVYDRVRERVAFMGSHQDFPADLGPLVALVRSGGLLDVPGRRPR